MKYRLLSLFFALVLLTPQISFAQEDTVVTGPKYRTELWRGKILTATFRAGMCFAPNGKAKGVFILRHSNGDEDVYHVLGTWENNHFNLKHNSGHKFSGEFVSDSKVKGKVKLNRGMTLSMSGDRTRNVRLVAHDCAPIE